MEEFLSYEFYGNTIGAWAGAFCLVILVAVIAKAVYWALSTLGRKLTAKTEARLDDIVLDMIEEPIVVAVALGGTWYSINTLNLPEGLTLWVGKVVYIVGVLLFAWLLTRLFEALVEEYVVPFVEETESDFDDQLLPILRRGVRMAIWALAVIVGADNAGYDIGAVIAGLGIGGLAFALAAQDSVANLFGGVTIFVDQPFTIHDRIVVEEFDGYVREIGLRSTRIETLNNRMVTIPNSRVANASVTNISSEPAKRETLILGLTYGTSHERLGQAMDILRDICEDTEGVEVERVIMDSFGAYSLNLECVYHIAVEYDPWIKRGEFNYEVLRRFNEAGLDFAFPTQTLHLEKAA